MNPSRGRAAVRRALELGINYLDTAPTYGNSEEVTKIVTALQRSDDGAALHALLGIDYNLNMIAAVYLGVPPSRSRSSCPPPNRPLLR